MCMKWIIGGFSHETNTFSTVSTDLEAFRAQTYLVGDEVGRELAGTQTPIGGFLDVVGERGDEVVPTVAAHATPSGRVTREAFDEICGHILAGVRANRDADGILLSLHGAMVPEGLDDGEGEVLRRVRDVVGAEVPIVAVLDLHSHITDEMLTHASALVGYQKYPHTDTYERGCEAAVLLGRIASGEVQPVYAVRKPPMLPVCGTCNTEAGFYTDLWREALREGRPKSLLSTSLFPGFSYADVPEAGFAVLVYTDADGEAAEAEAQRLSDMAWEGHRAFAYTPTPVSEAVARALASERGPVVIADISDNPGGGGSNDSVEILRELHRQGAENAAVAAIYDPAVVSEAVAAGVGAEITTDLGAKTDALHGEPVRIHAYVRQIIDGRFQYTGPMTRGAWSSLGKSAVLEADGVRVVVASKRVQSRDPEIFRVAGIRPESAHVLVVKSAVHFRAAFEGMASEMIVADGPGLTALDMSLFPFTRVRRPLFPLDDI